MVLDRSRIRKGGSRSHSRKRCFLRRLYSIMGWTHLVPFMVNITLYNKIKSTSDGKKVRKYVIDILLGSKPLIQGFHDIGKHEKPVFVMEFFFSLGKPGIVKEFYTVLF